MSSKRLISSANGYDAGTAGRDARSDWIARAIHAVGRAAVAGLVASMIGAPAWPADVIRGAQTYAKHCAACHGPKGMSVMPNAPHLARGERMIQPDTALLASLKAGKNAMPAYVGILSDREILDVIAYSRTLRQ